MANGYCTAQSRSRFSTDVLKIPQWLPRGGSQIPLSSPFSFLSVPPQRPWTQWNSPFLKITMLSISWDINSFGLGQLSSICLANSYFAFGAQLSNHFPHLMPWATSTLPLPLPDIPPMGLIAHIEHLARWILVPSLFVYIPHQTALWGQGTSLLCCSCILTTNTVPPPGCCFMGLLCQELRSQKQSHSAALPLHTPMETVNRKCNWHRDVPFLYAYSGGTEWYLLLHSILVFQILFPTGLGRQ